MAAKYDIKLQAMNRPAPTSGAIKSMVRDLFFTHMGGYIRGMYLMRQVRSLPVVRFREVLDAGCGDGRYAFDLAGKFPHLHVTGIDIQLPGNESPHGNPILVQGDLTELADRNIYDLIYCVDVLEHIPDNVRVVTNLYKALKAGGYLCLHMPNKREEKSIFPIRFLKDFQAWKEREHTGEVYTMDELRTLIEASGFEVLAARHTFGTLGQFVWELDRITDRALVLKAIAMPFLKVLAHLAVLLPAKRGDLFLTAQKSGKQEKELP
jgi:2-polyprenyl-3-methyl-5-hydroxy-6-metoxy-1,4-benzoquinol methylase